MTTSPGPDAGSDLLDRIVPAWRDALPATVSRAYFDQFVARNRGALVQRLAALAGPPVARPRAGRAAVQALVRRLALMPAGVRVGSVRYHSPVWLPGEEQVEITFRGEGSEGATMTLEAAPRVGEEIDLRGAITDGEGRLVAGFDWTVMSRSDLILLRETALARWFGVATTPEDRMPPHMLQPLAILRAEEDSSSVRGGAHPWQGVNDLAKDPLIARGLAVEVPDPGGGPPRYKTTPAGRRRLAETGTHVPLYPDAAAFAEEERMGVALRAERDREEAEFAESLERGMAHEAGHGFTGREARTRVLANLRTDPHFYHPRPASRRFAPATVYPLQFSQQSLAELVRKLEAAGMPTSLHVAGYDFHRASTTIDETGFVLVVYRADVPGNPRPARLASGTETRAFVPGPLVMFLTPRGPEAVFSIELQRHDGHQVVSSSWVKAPVERIAGLTSAEVAELVGLERPEQRR